MVRSIVAAAVFLSAVATGQASVPKSSPPDATAPSDLGQSYLVFFEAGKASLTPQARQVLRIAAQRAHELRQVKVSVIVPTVTVGPRRLLQSRARAVKAELVRDGVKPRSIGNADQPENVSNPDLTVRAWLDRSAVVKISPLPIADSNRQV